MVFDLNGARKMSSMVHQPSVIKLSICITTFNRAAFIAQTLESILAQLTSDSELVVLDGASTDDTARVVSKYANRFGSLRYVRQERNNGLDRDYDRAVELARGEYCWLMTDDDLLKPGAVAAVLDVLHENISVVIVNAEVKDVHMAKTMQGRWLSLKSDRIYLPPDLDRLFVDVGEILRYIGAFIVKRSLWLTRERKLYYDSWFIYIGVIFQERLPGAAVVLAEPLISYRQGNAHTFSPHVIEIVFDKWPSVVRSLALSETTKRKVYSVEPWRHVPELLLWRGLGCYSLGEYQRWVRPRLRVLGQRALPMLAAVLPGVLVNAFFVFAYSFRQDRGRWLHALRGSPFYLRKWRIFKRPS